MTIRQHARRLVWPAILTLLALAALIFRSEVAALFGTGDTLPAGLWALVYFAAAWLVSRLLALVLDQTASRRRPYPRLLRDLIAALVFLVAFAASASMYLGQGAIGALAGSGLIIAMLGFAIRNVVADTLSGIALGIEGPFRIGDWIDIEGLARGKVIEIGWRTTRILTRDATYVILPNSQIARLRITNYSAPKPQYRAQVTVTLDHSIPVARARKIMQEALQSARLIQQDPAPDIRVQAYGETGITYALRFWLSRFDRDIDCRDEVFSLVDGALREAGIVAPHRRIELIGSGAGGAEGGPALSGLSGGGGNAGGTAAAARPAEAESGPRLT